MGRGKSGLDRTPNPIDVGGVLQRDGHPVVTTALGRQEALRGPTLPGSGHGHGQRPIDDGQFFHRRGCQHFDGDADRVLSAKGYEAEVTNHDEPKEAKKKERYGARSQHVAPVTKPSVPIQQPPTACVEKEPTEGHEYQQKEKGGPHLVRRENRKGESEVGPSASRGGGPQQTSQGGYGKALRQGFRHDEVCRYNPQEGRNGDQCRQSSESITTQPPAQDCGAPDEHRHLDEGIGVES